MAIQNFLGKIFSKGQSSRPPLAPSSSLPEPAPAQASPQVFVVMEKSKLENFISSLANGIIIFDNSFNIILINQATETITGFTAQELIGKPIDQAISLKDNNNQTFSVTQYCQYPAGASLEQNAFILAGKGQKIAVRVTVIYPMVIGQNNQLTGILVLQNMTEEKVFEQMQIDFVSMASHEFRTPVTSIINYLSVLSEEAKDKLDAEQKDFLTRALTSAQQLSYLVDNMLNVSKIERGSLALAIQSVDWQKNLVGVVEDTQAQAMQRNISLQLSLPAAQLPKVSADKVRINEVLYNLISNAIKYTKEGGKIVVGARLSGNEVVTFVSDNGQGIPKEILPHLFTKFFRAPGSLEKGVKGSGLGLYIAKSIIDLHHGKIWVESEVGKGTTFYFSLPIGGGGSLIPSLAQLLPY